MRSAVFVLLLSTMAWAWQDHPRDLESEAHLHYVAGRHSASADAYEAAIRAGADSSSTFYNAACSSALAGRTDAAFRLLAACIERGWFNVTHMKSDSDLASLHQDERWSRILERCVTAEAEYLKSLTHPELRKELLEMQRVDQEYRSTFHDPKKLAAMGDVDGRNTARMKEIIDRFGFPTRTMVGREGAGAAWLLVQHADADPKFQRRCLDMMSKLPPDEYSRSNLAYLTDRVRVAEGKPQLYGTQFHTVDGKLVPRPIEDEANLDRRRKEVGLQSMAEYTKLMRGLPGR